jgi:pyridoxamine 5'-phosphate oxidase
MNLNQENTVTINNIQYDLQSIETLAWKKLINGSVKKKNGFRTICVGTINENGETSLRTVINRKVDETTKTIYFYTDNRSRKFQDILIDNRVTLLFYDSKQRIQISLRTKAVIHTNDELSEEKWRNNSSQARLGYMTIEAPNTKSEHPTLGYDEKFSLTKPTEIESDVFKNNFSVIACTAYELEFLYLDFSGNRKANFYYENGNVVDAYWAVP